MLRPTAGRTLRTTLALLGFLLLTESASASPPKELQICAAEALPKTGKAQWHKKRNRLLTKTASPRHMAEDLLVGPATPITLRGKLTYGSMSKDLNGEDVEVWVHDCSRWKLVGTVKTDSDGWAKLPLKSPKAPGVYEVVFRVRGDLSIAGGRLWVAPPSRQIVVFDIDGTLTTDDEQIRNEVFEDHFNEIGSGKHDPKTWPGAVDMTQAISGRGDLIVYLSGRPYWLVPHSRHWLEQHGFAHGVVLHTRRHREVAPEVKGVGAFKLDRINELTRAGFEVVEAYGNAATDVWAYSAAGIPPKATWIIGPLKAKGGAHDVKGGWAHVLATIRGAPARSDSPATQNSSSE